MIYNNIYIYTYLGYLPKIIGTVIFVPRIGVDSDVSFRTAVLKTC